MGAAWDASPVLCGNRGLCSYRDGQLLFSQGSFSECALLILKDGCPLSGQQGLPPQPAALLGPLQLSRSGIFTAPHHKGFRQGMTWKYMAHLCFSLSVVWAESLWIGQESCLWSNLQTQSTDFGRSCHSLAAWGPRVSGDFAYPWVKAWEGIWRRVTQHSKPCPVKELCSQGGTHTAPFLNGCFPHLTTAPSTAQKWLKCSNISHQYSTFLRTGGRQADLQPLPHAPLLHTHANLYWGRNHKDLSLLWKEHIWNKA